MEFNDVQRVVREALRAEHGSLPPVGSKAPDYDHAAVGILKALDEAGFTVERKTNS